MPKQELEFTPYTAFGQESMPIKGQTERIVASDPETGVATRILEFEPGTDTTPAGVQIHDFWEEVFILEGSLIDLTLNKEFKRGSVACRPPGMKHGPWKAPNGCKTFEVRYYLKK